MKNIENKESKDRRIKINNLEAEISFLESVNNVYDMDETSREIRILQEKYKKLTGEYYKN